MKCFVYKGNKKDGLYLYLAQEGDFSNIPSPLMQQLGKPELALTLELTESTTLNRENPTTVLHNLHTQGFHVQLPESVESLLARHNNQTLH